MLKELIATFPIMSLFRSGEPLYMLTVPLAVAILEMFVLLHLAWYSIGIKVPVKKSILPVVIQGLLTFLLRQVIPVFLHLIPVLVIFVIIVWKVGRTTLFRAIIGVLFTEVAVFIGSLLVVAPILRNNWAFNTSLGFALGAVLETVFPAIVLGLIIKYRFRLMR